MIRYTLRCDRDHEFESWFQSVEAYDALRDGGRLACPDCGSAQIEKALMAPRVRTGRDERANDAPDLAKPKDEKERALAELRRKIEAESDYVGLNFTSEARAMHTGEIPHRAIYGEAKTEDAKKLIEDGVPVAPLPFTPKARTN